MPQKYLCGYDDTVIIVSHDRSFLNEVATDIIHYHLRDLKYYPGNFDAFEKAREDRLSQLSATQESIDRKRAHIEASIGKMKGAMARNSRDEKRGKLVTSRERKLERLGAEKTLDGKKFNCQTNSQKTGAARRVGSVNDNAGGWVKGKMSAAAITEASERELVFNFPAGAPLATRGPVVQLSEASFAYAAGGRQVLSGVTLDVTLGSRIAVLGRNGSGKSTLLGLIAGTLEATGGETHRARQLRVASFTQHHVDSLRMDVTPLAHMVAAFPAAKEFDLRSHLGAFGITGGLALQRVSALSGGQKSRVVFATITWARPQLLIMDEPTNHLDFESIAALTKGLREFAGGVVVVSHDAALLTDVCSELIVVSGGTAARFEGGVEGYKRALLAGEL